VLNTYLFRRVSWRIALREVVIVVGAALSYFAIRSLMETSYDRAVTNGWRIVDLERWLGISWEERMQAAIIESDWIVRLLNWVYIYGHWPFIVSVALWLLFRRPGTFFTYRNAFLFSGGIGLVIFATFPVAPPRLLDLDLVDTITEHSRSYRVLQPPAFTNQYAAVPSLHFGWNLLMGIVLVRNAPWPVFKVVGVLSPVLMFFATVLTANHYIVDAIFGAIVALIGLWLAVHGRRVLGPPAMRAWRSARSMPGRLPAPRAVSRSRRA
jgi:hypothetical protein